MAETLAPHFCVSTLKTYKEIKIKQIKQKKVDILLVTFSPKGLYFVVFFQQKNLKPCLQWWWARGWCELQMKRPISALTFGLIG